MEKNFKLPLRKPTFTQSLSLLREASYHLSQFVHLGIKMDDQNCLVFDFEKISYIKEEVDKDSWGFGLPLVSALALQLACHQEDVNDYLPQDEIDRVNRFFEVQINRDLIDVMGSKYI
jgi:hypothetical protein